MRIPGYEDPERAARYGKRPATTRAEVRALRRLLGGTAPGLVVLDVPCGNGRLAPALRELRPARLLGADGSPAMAARARPVCDGVVVADASRLPLPDRAADLVVCVRLLHHFPASGDRRRILRELRRVSRGKVVLSYYRAATLEGLRRRLRPKRPSGRTGLSGAALRADLAAAGLRLLRSRSLLPLVREQTLVLAGRA